MTEKEIAALFDEAFRVVAPKFSVYSKDAAKEFAALGDNVTVETAANILGEMSGKITRDYLIVVLPNLLKILQ